MRNKTLTYLHLAPGAELPPAIDRFSPYLAILLVEDDSEQMWQWDISRQLVASGCRYLLAWGRDCEAWREAVEDAALEAADYEDVPDERRVLATAHEDEDMEEAFWFAKHRAAHPAVPLNATLLIHIAPQARKDETKAAYADA